MFFKPPVNGDYLSMVADIFQPRGRGNSIKYFRCVFQTPVLKDKKDIKCNSKRKFKNVFYRSSNGSSFILN